MGLQAIPVPTIPPACRTTHPTAAGRQRRLKSGNLGTRATSPSAYAAMMKFKGNANVVGMVPPCDEAAEAGLENGGRHKTLGRQEHGYLNAMSCNSIDCCA